MTFLFDQAKARNGATHTKAGVEKILPKRVSLARNRKVRWDTCSHIHVHLADLRSYVANKCFRRNHNVEPEELVQGRKNKRNKGKQA